MSYYRYIVTGRGEFPQDMLRHDQARYPHWPLGDSVDMREVVVEGKRAPNVARWESFGWTVAGTRRLDGDLPVLPNPSEDVPATGAGAW